MQNFILSFTLAFRVWQLERLQVNIADNELVITISLGVGLLTSTLFPPCPPQSVSPLGSLFMAGTRESPWPFSLRSTPLVSK